MKFSQSSLATAAAAVVSLLCFAAITAHGASFTGANVVLADQTYSSITDITPAAPGNVVTIDNAVFDEVLNFRVRQSTITVRNSVFKKYLSFSDASLDWSHTTIVVENCTIDAQQQGSRYPSMMMGYSPSASVDGGGTSTWTIVNNRFPGIIWMPKVLSNFALVNISFNQDIVSASVDGPSNGMIFFESVSNVAEFHIEGNHLDAAGGKTDTLVGGSVATTFSNMSLTVKDNVATRGRFFVLFTACTQCTWTITGNQYYIREEGLLDQEAPIHLGQFRDSNVSVTFNNITYMTLPKTTSKITYGVSFFAPARATDVQNFRYTATGNNFSLSGDKGYAHRLPPVHGPDVYFNIINDTLFHTSVRTYIALVGEGNRREHTGLHVTIRGCHGPADEYEASSYLTFSLIARASDNVFHSTITIEDNVIGARSASVGYFGGIGPGSTVTVRRNKFSALAVLGDARIASGSVAIVEDNEIGTSNAASLVKNVDYLHFYERINIADGLASVRIHCNKVNGEYARFYNPLKWIHTGACSGGGKCDSVHNNSVCPGDPTPLASAALDDATVTISGATLPEYQPVIVQDNQVLKLAGGTVATRLMIVPHSLGSTACLTNATIEVESATVLRALYVDGGLCGGRFIARHALFNDTDETTYGFLGIRDGWDNAQVISIEHSELKIQAPLDSTRVIGIVPALHFSNISANAVLKVQHSSVHSFPLTFPELSDETSTAFVVSNVSMLSSAGQSCVSFPTDLAVTFDGITGVCTYFFHSATKVGTKARMIKRSSITAITHPIALFTYSNGGDVPIVVEDTVFTFPTPTTPSNSGKGGIAANAGSKFTRCVFNFEEGHTVTRLVYGFSITVQDCVFNVAKLRPENIIDPVASQPQTYVFENVTVNALDVGANSQSSTPVVALIRGSVNGLTMTMRDVAFNFPFSSTAFPRGTVWDTSNFPPTLLKRSISDVLPVLLRGTNLKGTFLFENVAFGNISSIAQEVPRLTSVNMTLSNVSFSEPQQIRNFQPTGVRLNTTNLLFGVADEAVLNREFGSKPPLLDVTNLLRLNFTGCTTMGGEPLRAERIRVALSNLTSVPGALVIDDRVAEWREVLFVLCIIISGVIEQCEVTVISCPLSLRRPANVILLLRKPRSLIVVPGRCVRRYEFEWEQRNRSILRLVVIGGGEA